MSKKLYTIKATYDYVVVADNIHDAYLVGRQYFKDALSDMPSTDVDLAAEQGVHAYGWDDDCIPYGGDGNTRTGEYLKKD